jgi:uncharacterized protein with PIN domain
MSLKQLKISILPPNASAKCPYCNTIKQYPSVKDKIISEEKKGKGLSKVIFKCNKCKNQYFTLL